MKQMYKFFVLVVLFLSISHVQAQSNCSGPIDNRTFTGEYARLSSISVGADREIRKFTADYCVSSRQIAQLAALYYYDNDRYNYALYAYPLAVDPQNYYLVADAMANEASRQRLTRYIDDNPLGVAPAPAPMPMPNPNHHDDHFDDHQDNHHGDHHDGHHGDHDNIPAPMPIPAPIIYVPGYTGRIGCPMPMSGVEFSDAMNSINKASFESSKLSLAKQIANSKCFTAAQAKTMVEAFDFESSKLDFAKYAYSHTYDIDNYHIVSGAFDFSSSTTALVDYMNSNTPANLPYAGQIVQPAPVQPGYGGGSYYTPPPAVIYVPGYTGRVGCGMPMTDAEFNSMKASVASKNFDNMRLEFASQAVSSRCLTVNQVKQLCALFQFDNYRLDFAKAAYNHTYDIDNYYQVADVFQFQSNGQALMKHIRG